jgi:predicted transcriptional regulator
MLTVKNIMMRDLITVSPDTEIVHAAKLLLEKGINGIPLWIKKGSWWGSSIRVRIKMTCTSLEDGFPKYR